MARLLQNRIYCQLKSYIGGIGNYAFFWQKIGENITKYSKIHGSSSTEPDLLPIEVLHWRNRKLCVFLAKNWGKYNNILFAYNINAEDAETHFLACMLPKLPGTCSQSVVLRQLGGYGHFHLICH